MKFTRNVINSIQRIETIIFDKPENRTEINTYEKMAFGYFVLKIINDTDKKNRKYAIISSDYRIARHFFAEQFKVAAQYACSIKTRLGEYHGVCVEFVPSATIYFLNLDEWYELFIHKRTRSPINAVLFLDIPVPKFTLDNLKRDLIVIGAKE